MNSIRVAALSTTFESALLKRVKNFAFCGCVRRPVGDPPEPTVPPYAARRRFARRLSVHSGPKRQGEHLLLATFNV
jgi:hypothetical protein